MSNYVFVIDTDKNPCDPVHPAKARLLLNQNKAAVFRRYPFTIILKEGQNARPTPLTVKIDPGSKTTGLAILRGEDVI
ncbi:MAG: RRXRR domain-containing protein, partial [Cyanobacteriota bacterium]